MLLKDKKLPVLVLIEGWGAAGKGSAIGQIIKNIDPRFFKVFSMPSTPTEEERRKPFLYRFFEKIPEAGKFTFLDSGWMDQIMHERLDGRLDDKEYAQRVDSVKRFERGLTDNGYLGAGSSSSTSARRSRRSASTGCCPARTPPGGWGTGTCGRTSTTTSAWRPSTATWRTPTPPAPPGISSTPRIRNSRSSRPWRPCAPASTPPCTTRAWPCPCCRTPSPW